MEPKIFPTKFQGRKIDSKETKDFNGHVLLSKPDSSIHVRIDIDDYNARCQFYGNARDSIKYVCMIDSKEVEIKQVIHQGDGEYILEGKVWEEIIVNPVTVKYCINTRAEFKPLP